MDSSPFGGIGRGTVRSDYSSSYLAPGGRRSMYGVDVDFSREKEEEKESSKEESRSRVTFSQQISVRTIDEFKFGNVSGSRSYTAGRGGATRGGGRPADGERRVRLPRRKEFDLETELVEESAGSEDSSDEEIGGRGGRRLNKKGERNWKHKNEDGYFVNRFSWNQRHFGRRSSDEVGFTASWRNFGERTKTQESREERKVYDPSLITCFNCGGTGHISRYCNMPRKTRKPIICYTCQGEGHPSRLCPLNEGIYDEGGEDTGEANDAPIATNDQQNIEKTDKNEPELLIDVSPGDDGISGDVAADRSEEQDVITEDGAVNVIDTRDNVPHRDLGHELLLVNQGGKPFILLRLLLTSDGQNWKRSARCDCGLFDKCSCEKKVLIFVKSRSSVEYIKLSLEAFAVKVAAVHSGTEQSARLRQMASFNSGICPVMVVMASEAITSIDYSTTPVIDWLINYDMPVSSVDYDARIEMVQRREGKPLRVTSFYDDLVDRPMLEALKKIKIDAGEQLPDWLNESECSEALDEDEEEGVDCDA